MCFCLDGNNYRNVKVMVMVQNGQTFVIGGSIQYPINNNLETFNKSNYKIL